MSKMKTLSEAKTQLSLLARAAALEGDFEGYKGLKALLEQLDDSTNVEAVNKALTLVSVLNRMN
jgi:hypothetical protein